ncbi:hypothetical protein GPALN_010429 [Globodera pallida]|nr:hypothetical protein GPALN_010429 [Globodera pallida]
MTFQNYSMANLAFDRFGIGTFSGELFLSTLFRWLISLPGLLFNAALLNTIARDNYNLLEEHFFLYLSPMLAVTFGYSIYVLATAAQWTLFVYPDWPVLCGNGDMFSFGMSTILLRNGLVINGVAFICYALAFDRFGIGTFSGELFLSTLFRWLISLPGLLFNAALLNTIARDNYNLLEEHFFLYLSPMLAVTFGYSIYVLVTAAQWTLFVYPDWPVLCGNGDMFSFGMSTILLRNGLVINGVAFICYALVGLVLLRCWQKNPSAVVKHRIFKSLAAIMTLVVGSYLAVCVFRLLLAHVTNPLFVLHISPSVTALFTVISASSNAPLLFAFSFGMSTILLRNGLVINGVAFICYALVGLVLLRCWQKNPSAVVKHRIFKSLAAIMTLVVGSYLAVCVFRLLLAHVTNPLFVLHISPSVTALFTVISASSNAPLLFAFSSEYRLAFHKHLRGWPLLGKWLIRMEQQTQIAVTVNFNAVNSSNIVSRVGPITTIASSRNSTVAPMRMTSIE